MNSKKIIAELKKQYPGKNIIVNEEKGAAEIICEIDPASEHPTHSLALAVIDVSKEHFHKRSAEIYYVAKGKLTLQINGTRRFLKENEWWVIEPGQLHSARGEETWVYIYSEPGWTKDDHYFQTKADKGLPGLSFDFSRHIILTSRFQQMLEFYQQALGFQLKSVDRAGGRAELCLSNLNLSLIDKDKFLKNNKINNRQILSFKVASLDTTYKQLEKKGVSFFKKPNLILDPDNNLVHISDR